LFTVALLGKPGLTANLPLVWRQPFQIILDATVKPKRETGGEERLLSLSMVAQPSTFFSTFLT